MYSENVAIIRRIMRKNARSADNPSVTFGDSSLYTREPFVSPDIYPTKPKFILLDIRIMKWYNFLRNKTGDDNMKLQGLKINFLGDSITEGVGVSSVEKVYFNLLKERCGLAEARGYGISGTRFAKQRKKSETASFDLDFNLRAVEMDDDADVVVVFGGTNDYGHGDAPFGTDSDRTPDSFCGACHSLMRLLKEKYVGKVVVFMTPLHRENENVPRFDGHVLADFVEVIKKTAVQYSIPVLDLYGASGIQPDISAIKEAFAPDGLHPNDAGQNIIAERLEAFLLSY